MMTPPDLADSEVRSALLAAREEAARQAEEVLRLQDQALQLSAEKERLEAVVTQLTALLAAKDALVAKLNQAIKDLRVLKFGRKSEKLAPGQLALAFEDLVQSIASLEAQIDAIEDEAAKVAGGEDQPIEKRRRAKRDPEAARASLPEHLPVVEETIEPESVECPCCRGELHRIGETIAKRLDVVPVQ
jgi:transposase